MVQAVVDVDDVDRGIAERKRFGVGDDERDVQAVAPRPLARLEDDAERDVREDDACPCARKELGIDSGASADRQRGGAG
jgi:hypothetical protein